MDGDGPRGPLCRRGCRAELGAAGGELGGRRRDGGNRGGSPHQRDVSGLTLTATSPAGAGEGRTTPAALRKATAGRKAVQRRALVRSATLAGGPRSAPLQGRFKC